MSHWLRIAWMTAFLISGHLTSQARCQRKLVPVVLILAQAPQVLGHHLRRGMNYVQRSRIANLLLHPDLDSRRATRANDRLD